MGGHISVTELGNWSGLATGQVTVSTAGTREQLPERAIPDGTALVVRAAGDNSGDVFVGDDTVDSGSGFALGPGESVAVQVSDASTISVDAATDGDAISWLVEVED